MNKIDAEMILKIVPLSAGLIFGLLGIIQIASMPRIFSRYLYYPILYFLMVLWLIQPDLFHGFKKIENKTNLTFILGLYILCWTALFIIIRYTSYIPRTLIFEIFVWMIPILAAIGYLYDGYKQLNNQKVVYLRVILILFTIITLIFFFLLGIPKPRI